MPTQQHQRIAARLLAAHRARARYQPLADTDRPDSLDEAYDLQRAVYDCFGSAGGLGKLGGHKIALTSAALQAMCGLDAPVYGAFFASEMHQSPAKLPLSAFGRLGLEFEVAVQLAIDVPTPSTPYDRESIAPFVRACMPAFELIDDRDADYTTLDAYSLIADRCWCGGIVLGAPMADWQSLDLAACAATLVWNDKTEEEAVTGASMDHPFNGLAWVANHLLARGETLRAGDIVMTGSAMKTRFPLAGDSVVYRIAGLGEVAIEIATR